VSEDTNTIHQRRVDQILSARERVQEVDGHVQEMQIHGQYSDYAARRYLRTAVGQYLREVRALINPDLAPEVELANGAQDYWRDVPIGPLHLPDGTTMHVDSLQTFYRLPNPWVYEYREVGGDGTDGVGQVRRRQRVQPSLELSREAASLVDIFLADAGLEADPTDDKVPTYGGIDKDHEDIVWMNADEWREVRGQS